MSIILGLIIVIFIAIFGMLTGFFLYGIGKYSVEEDRKPVKLNYTKYIQDERYRTLQRQISYISDTLDRIDHRLHVIERYILPDEEVRADGLKKIFESMKDDAEDNSQK